jgi:hypothetical protein
MVSFISIKKPWLGACLKKAPFCFFSFFLLFFVFSLDKLGSVAYSNNTRQKSLGKQRKGSGL